MWKLKQFIPKETVGLEGRALDIGKIKVQVRKTIAEGGFSCVYLAVDALQPSKQYALKHMMCSDEESMNLVRKEINVMKILKGHQNIVTLVASDIFDTGRNTEAFVLMEFCDKSLVSVLENRGSGYYDEKQILLIFRDICNAVFAMHCQSPPIAHRDLKAENLLLGSDGAWKLCDFGSTSTNHKRFDKPGEMGIEEDNIRKYTTPAYRSPEMWDLYRREVISEKVDIWVAKKNERVAVAAAAVKKEKINGQAGEEGGGDCEDNVPQGLMERRVLRSRYLDVKNQINDDMDTLCEAERFSSIIGQVESLHQHVQKPREQVVDAEALLDIANSLVTTIKSYGNEGFTPSDFITRLIENFGQQDVVSSSQGKSDIISWTDLGLMVSPIFRNVPGCCTMLGPMDTELKQRKNTRSKRTHLPASATTCPKEVEENESGKRTDTDKNMSTMFKILTKQRNVRLENLVLNRGSFAQTVENIFALSFLVKDGRASITMNESGHHIISPRNYPSLDLISSGEVSFSHFIFRFDFLDWKFMLKTVIAGEELMPNRTSSLPGCSHNVQTLMDSEDRQTSTPIRKLSRNRALVTHNCSVGDDVLNDDTSEQRCLAQKRRRLFRG